MRSATAWASPKGRRCGLAMSKMRQMACKPGSVPRLRGWMTIPLGRPLPDASRDQPGRRAEDRPMCHPYSVLLLVGLAVPSALPHPR